MRSIYTFTVILICCFQLGAQNTSLKKEQAKALFFNAKYTETLAILLETRALLRDDKECRFWAAVCHYQLNQLDQALEGFTALTQERSPYPECWLYLGHIFHARHEFEEASRNYKLYLRTIGPNHANRAMVVDAIRRASNGHEWQFQQPLAVVENLGAGVNTAGDEFGPVISPNHSDRLYFTSTRPGNTGGARTPDGRPDEKMGQFFADMFSSRLSAGSWGQTAPMHFLLNSPRHEVLLDFNRTGDVLLYFKGWGFDQGEMVVDTFRDENERRFSSTPFNGPLDFNAGDAMPFIYQDTLLLFASRRPGGLGGWDLYHSTWKNGRWSAPANLGAPVNTPYDEVTPFLARDGRTLFFSSNDSRKSIGGLDVFKTVRNQEDGWVQPYNLGLPINSAGDDAYFRFAKDGFTAFFSSSRKDGYGQRDIYAAYFQEYQEEMELPQDYRPVNKPVPVTHNTQPSFEESVLEPPAGTNEPWSFSLVLPPDSAPLDENNRSKLDEIAGLLNQYSGLTLVITAYAPEGRAINKGLYAAIQRSGAISKYLLSQGVPAEKLFTRSISVPGAKGSGLQVDLGFTGVAGLPIEGQAPVVGGEVYKAGYPGLTVNRALHYKIQVASSKGEIGTGFLAAQPDPMVEKTPDFAFFRYTVGAFLTFREAAEYLKNIQQKGFPDAFIVPYIYGARADKYRVKRHLGEFPDLENYLKG